MIRRYFLLGFLFFLLACSSLSNSAYVDTDLGFALDFPDDWGPVVVEKIVEEEFWSEVFEFSATLLTDRSFRLRVVPVENLLEFELSNGNAAEKLGSTSSYVFFDVPDSDGLDYVQDVLSDDSNIESSFRILPEYHETALP